MTETTLENLQQKANPPAIGQMPSVQIGCLDFQSFELTQRVAKMFSNSTIVPREYQNNLGNCVVAINMSARIGADPLMVMQNLVIVHGKPTWSAQFLIATFNKCGRFSSIRYRFVGDPKADNYGCVAWATELSSNEVIESSMVTIELAKKEGWYGKPGSKWQTMPQQMLMYRAAAWMVRAYAPEIAMGLHTTDEIEDGLVYDAKADSSGRYEIAVGDIQRQEQDKEMPETPVKRARRENPPQAEEKAAPAADTKPNRPALTYAEIAERINKAKTEGEAKSAALLIIPNIGDAGQSEELRMLFEVKMKELGPVRKEEV
jgi:hypothetical protein